MNPTIRHSVRAAVAFFTCSLLTLQALAQDSLPDQWRAERRIIDLHMHVAGSDERIERGGGIMDRVGIGVGVNLSGDTTVPTLGKVSRFTQNKDRADRLAPHRWVHYMNLDYAKWDEPDFSEQAVKQIEEGFRQGAAGLKEYKRLGLYLKDKSGKLITIDDPKLDPVWQRCGELGMPVSIHVADPKAFWMPYDEHNERWIELKDHKSWWFGDPEKYPSREELLEARNRVLARHPGTTFVCVHFGNNPEDIDWVDRALDKFPNMMVDIAARVPELGRHDPAKVRALFEKHQDRIFFATDFMVYDKLILGSGGDGPGPTDDEAVAFYDKHWRWFETNDRQFAHMTPIQGEWKIDAVGLDPSVLRKVYFDNAHRLLVRTLPPPVLQAARINVDFEIDGKLNDVAWRTAAKARIDYGIRDGAAHPALSSSAQVLWSDAFLYIGYSAPFTNLTTFEPVSDSERAGLWDRDVVEAFIGSEPDNVGAYTEFEVAPTGEKLDLSIELPEKSLEWNSGFQARVHIDLEQHIWMTEMRIPLSAITKTMPIAGETVWRLNLYRSSNAEKVFLGWAPTATGSAHTPERFGYLQF
ncbi:MAG: amidohydrolase family protein [Verrucomicrobiales bacterium]